MIEFDPFDYMKTTVSDKELTLISAFCGDESAYKLLYEFQPKYDNILKNGSDELIEVVFLHYTPEFINFRGGGLPPYFCFW